MTPTGPKTNRPRPGQPRRAWSLVELITVLSVISLLMGILLPVLQQVRRRARGLQAQLRQRQVGLAVNLYALDHDGRYPESVAKVGFGSLWNWSDPTKLAGSDLRTPGQHRSVAAYLGSYLPQARTLVCPSVPQPTEELQQAWRQADRWDHPDTPVGLDPVGGSVGLFWNYQGLLSPDGRLWRGPTGPAGRRGRSRLLIGHYLAYNHWRAPGQWLSCEPMPRAAVVERTLLLSSFWASPGQRDHPPAAVRLTATYTDEHVESVPAGDTVELRVIKDRQQRLPYADDEPGPGRIRLPRNAQP